MNTTLPRVRLNPETSSPIPADLPRCEISPCRSRTPEPATVRVTLTNLEEGGTSRTTLECRTCAWYSEAHHQDMDRKAYEAKVPFNVSRTVERLLFRIPEQNLPLLRDRVAKLSKRAEKLMGEKITLTETWSTLDEIPKTDGTKMFRRWTFVRIDGPRPILAGWEFVATIQHEEGGNVLRTSPKFEGDVPKGFRKLAQGCDHCRQTRDRLSTYIVRNVEENSFKQVGSSCLRDFLGHVDPKSVAAYLQFLFDLEDEAGGMEGDEGFGGCRISAVDLHSFLSIVAESIKRDGWNSRGASRINGKTATADRAVSSIFTKKKEEKIIPGPEAIETATKSIDRVRAWEGRDDLSDYEWNLFVSLGGDVLNLKNTGIAASAVSAYLREMERLEFLKREQRTNEYRGTIGKRENLTVTIVSIRTLDSDWGTSHLVKMLDESGRLLTTFASNEPAIPATYKKVPYEYEAREFVENPIPEAERADPSVRYVPVDVKKTATRDEQVTARVVLNPGDVVKIRATPKKQEEYKGWKQTVLSRVEWKEVQATETEPETV